MSSLFAQSRMGDLEYKIEVTLSSSEDSLKVENVVVDTGFTGDFFLPYHYLDNLVSYGFRIYHLSPEESIRFGSGEEISGEEVYICSAKLRKVQEHEFTETDLTVEVLIYGSGDPLIGLKTLSNWIAKFDGPNRLLSLIK